MGLPLILAGLQVAGGIGGAIQGNQTRQKVKGEVGRAYKIGSERLIRRQGDQRQSGAESLVARGLAQGGNARAARPTGRIGGQAVQIPGAPNTNYLPTMAPVPVAGRPSRDLASQEMATMASEQELERRALRSQRDAAYAGADSGATQALIGGVTQAVAGGIQGYQSGQMFNAFGGINPVNPLQPMPQATTDSFNIFDSRA